MDRNRASKRVISLFMVVLLCFAAASFATLGCAAEAISGGEPASSFEGVWTGASAGAGGSSITLTLRGAKRSWSYGSPRSCDLSLEEPIPANGSGQRYGIVSTTGGFCDRCLMGKLTVTAGKAGGLAYTLTDSDDKALDSGQLRSAGR